MTTQIIVFVCALLIIVGAWVLLVYLRNKEVKEKTYIYPKTGQKYMSLFRCRMKVPSTGEWFDAIIYKGVEDEKFYVRERKDFLDKFVKLNDWENGNRKE